MSWDTQPTACCIVGGGPGGAMLALLLARAGVPVTLLERHSDFDRDFRGDTIHASVMEILDQLGLADRLLAELPHSKIRQVSVHTAEGSFRVADFGRLKTRFPYITMVPQVRFLEWITAEAARYPTFRLLMGARVGELVEEDGQVRGVRYRMDDGVHELRSALVVGADGRFSTVRKLAGLEPIATAPPVDVLWFRLPRETGDAAESGAAFLDGGRALFLLDRGGEWQIAFLIAKGSFRQMRDAGIETLRKAVATVVPWLTGRVENLEDWGQITLLSVEASRVPRWYRPGLLLIGDAAHVMSPVGGVGINYAIQDAVAAANVLAAPLRTITLTTDHLADVQRRREWPTRVIQTVQATALRRIIAPALASDRPFRLAPPLRILPRVRILRNLVPRLIAYGVRPGRVETINPG